MKKALLLTLVSAICMSGTAYAKEVRNGKEIVRSNAQVVEPVETTPAAQVKNPSEAVIISGGTAIEVPASEVTKSGKLIYMAKNFHEMAALPGYSIAAPSGLVSSWGVVFAGITGQTNSDNTDGALSLGMGLGDPNKYVGGSASLTIGSIDPRDGGSFNRGSLNLTMGHHFQKYKVGISAGVTGIDLWHNKSGVQSNDPSFYGAVTKLLPNEIAPVVITAGLGNNAYADVNSNNPKDKVYGFGSIAAYIIPQVSLIADYTSNIVTLGTGIVPFPDYPVSLTLAIKDITEQEADKPSFLGTLAAAYVF